MKARLVVLAVVVGVVGIQLSREPGRAVAPAPRQVSDPATGSTPAARPVVPPAAPVGRDPFRFATDAAVVSARPAFPAAVKAPPLPEPEPPRVRLVGLVRRAGELRAALVVDGAMVLASAGETVSGFRVLSIGADEGVRVRDPQGLEMALTLPEEP